MDLFWPGDSVWNRDFDRDPTSLHRRAGKGPGGDWLSDLALKLAVPRDNLERATIAGWRTLLCGERAESAGDIPLVLSAGVYHRDRTRHALQCCPSCLAEGVPHFRKEWRLGFMLSCPQHGEALQDACGRCGAAIIPHRSPSRCITDCHACGRPVAAPSRDAGDMVPPAAQSLQERLLAVLRGEAGTDGAWSANETFETVRTLLAASTSPAIHAALRNALGLDPGIDQHDSRRRFEHARHAVRARWLETVAAWMDAWPRKFLHGADAMGASQRTFARCRLPPSLAAEVARLPLRRKSPRKPWQPLLDEPVINGLRRTDRTAYHALRARRILNAIGVHADA